MRLCIEFIFGRFAYDELPALVVVVELVVAEAEGVDKVLGHLLHLVIRKHL